MYTVNLSVCGFLALVVIALFLYRRWLENRQDHYIHLHGDSHDSAIVSSQDSMCKLCDTVDKLKNGLLVAVILYALAIAAFAIYSAWNNPGS
jgi:hypothetical protein